MSDKIESSSNGSSTLNNCITTTTTTTTDNTNNTTANTNTNTTTIIKNRNSGSQNSSRWSHDIKIRKYDSIESLKRKISRRTGIATRNQRLIYLRKELRYGTLNENNIKNHATVTLSVSVQSGLLDYVQQDTICQEIIQEIIIKRTVVNEKECKKNDNGNEEEHELISSPVLDNFFRMQTLEDGLGTVVEINGVPVLVHIQDNTTDSSEKTETSSLCNGEETETEKIENNQTRQKMALLKEQMLFKKAKRANKLSSH
eukprot:Pgem_evm3s18550